MSRIGDALLLAISRGFLRITEAILNHSSFKMRGRLTRSPSEQKNSDEVRKDDVILNYSVVTGLHFDSL